MLAPYIPSEIKNLIMEWIEDSTYPSYGQIATVSEGKYPKVRTVHFRYSSVFDTIVFGCNTESHKWDELITHPFASACVFWTSRLIQLRFEGDVQLIDFHTQDPQEVDLRRMLWNQMRPDVRREYWKEVKQEAKSINEICPTLGAVILYPSSWDIYTLGVLNYGDGKRIRYTLTNSEWKKELLSLVSSKSLKKTL